MTGHATGPGGTRPEGGPARGQVGPTGAPPGRALVLALGDPARGDEGLGPAFLAWFQRRFRTTAGVRLVDGGSGGLGLVEWLDTGDDLLLVDALTPDPGEPPGLLRLRDRDELVAGQGAPAGAVHGEALGDLLRAAAWFGITLRSVQLLGLTTGPAAPGAWLGPEVRAALPCLAAALGNRLMQLGFPPPLRLPVGSLTTP